MRPRCPYFSVFFGFRLGNPRHALRLFLHHPDPTVSSGARAVTSEIIRLCYPKESCNGWLQLPLQYPLRQALPPFLVTKLIVMVAEFCAGHTSRLLLLNTVAKKQIHAVTFSYNLINQSYLASCKPDIPCLANITPKLQQSLQGPV